jgi:hypothetical protein
MKAHLLYQDRDFNTAGDLSASEDLVADVVRVIAERFRRRTDERTAAVREAASELFKIDLPRLEIPAVDSERERFFYLFLRVGSSSDFLSSLWVRFLPPTLVRRRALHRAKGELASEFANHAGRDRCERVNKDAELAGQWRLARELADLTQLIDQSEPSP